MHALLLLITLALAWPSYAGQAVRVIDGDGIELDGVSIRLWGVDAVEKRQSCTRNGASYPCGQDARTALQQLVEGKTIICDDRGKDRYRRTVARCVAGGVDLGGEMVRLGWALDFKRYSKGHYAALQAEAKAARRGLWDGTFELPKAWRKAH